MFLNVIPKDLKNEIFRERSLIGADHIRLAEWCRTRATVLQPEILAEIMQKNLTGFSKGKINAVKPNADTSESKIEVPPPPPPPRLADDVPV